MVAAATVSGSAIAQWSDSLWDTARAGDLAGLNVLLDRFADHAPGAGLESLQVSAQALKQHISDRETQRAERIAEVEKELDKVLAEPRTDFTLSKALRSTIELHSISLDKESVLGDARVKGLISASEAAARAAEVQGDVLTAGELFMLLDALLDVSGTYKPDVRRLIQRQEMLRLYVPERLYKLREKRHLASGEKEPLPPYNPFGDDYKKKLDTIDPVLIFRAIAKASQHVEQKPVHELLLGGVEAVRTMMTTADLETAFPLLADQKAVDAMLAFLDQEGADLRDNAQRNRHIDQAGIEQFVTRLRRQNDSTVKVPSPALLHEFGNGAMSKLDEFSAIIWPDELRRFEKNTQGRFVGIGVQIEYDELSNIRVVTPLEGTPAQRAGIHPGDIIKNVDGRPIWGLSLDQAVEVITGPEGTDVGLTLERRVGEDAVEKEAVAGDGAAGVAVEPEKVEVEVSVMRTMIEVPTVKGWRRDGIREDAWDWFIDKDNGIGYVRLSQFADNTSKELNRAIREMKAGGVKGLILDLRFNPGGLLDEAVNVSRRFIDVDGGFIVMTKGASGLIEDPKFTKPTQATLAHIPLVCLINEGSASASEIVSGAISTYAKSGDIDAVVLGGRSYGKGSVQNVWPLTGTSMMKVTTAYYMLPDKRIIHRRPGAPEWGVEPDLRIEMLPRQIADAISLRRNADVLPLDENGLKDRAAGAVAPNPDDLVTKGIDLQLETALVLLKGKAAKAVALAKPAGNPEAVVTK